MKWMRIVAVLVLLAVAAVVALVWALNSIDWSRYIEPVTARVEQATGRRLAVDGALRVHVGLRPSVSVSSVRFQNAAWGSRPEMAQVERFEVQLALWPLLWRRVEVQRIVLAGVDVLLEKRADGTANWSFAAPGSGTSEPGAPAAGGTPPAPKPGEPTPGEAPPAAEGGGASGVLALVHAVEVERARLVYADAASGTRRELELDHLDARMADPDAPLELELSARLEGEPVEIEGTLGGVAALTSGGPLDVELRGEAGGLRLRVDGRIREPLEGRAFALNVTAEGDRLDGLSRLAGTALPPLGPYRLAGALTDAESRYVLSDLALDVGESALRGRVSLGLSGPRPRLDAALTSPRLRLADFSASADAAAGAGGAAPAAPSAAGAPAPAAGKAAAGASASAAGDERLFSAEPWPLDSLAAADATVSLRADSLDLGRLVLADVEVGLALADRALRVDPFRAGMADGTLQGSVSLDGRTAPPSLSVDAGLAKLDVAALLRLAGVADALSESRLDGRLSVRGRGGSTRAWLAGLGGTAELSLGPGRIARPFAESVLGELGRLLLANDPEGRNLELNCALARFDLASGVADASGLAVDTRRVALLGSGDVDLGQEALDLRFEPVSKDLDLALASPPVRVGGTLAVPSIQVDRDALAGKALGAAITALQGHDVVKGRNLSTAEGVAGCEELVQMRKKLTGGKADEKTEKKLKKKLRKALGDEGGKAVGDALENLLGR